jgi:uncharacterized phage protein (TIGR01671 family)
MQEVRFRAWDYDTKQMLMENFIITPEGTVFRNGGADEEDIQLMQFTGLTDKNGKEIFDGDIVSLAGEKWTVMWDNPSAGFWLEGPQERKNVFSEPVFGKLNIGARGADCEVIGNIFQNGDLLGV